MREGADTMPASNFEHAAPTPPAASAAERFAPSASVVSRLRRMFSAKHSEASLRRRGVLDIGTATAATYRRASQRRLSASVLPAAAAAAAAKEKEGGVSPAGPAPSAAAADDVALRQVSSGSFCLGRRFSSLSADSGTFSSPKHTCKFGRLGDFKLPSALDGVSKLAVVHRLIETRRAQNRCREALELCLVAYVTLLHRTGAHSAECLTAGIAVAEAAASPEVRLFREGVSVAEHLCAIHGAGSAEGGVRALLCQAGATLTWARHCHRLRTAATLQGAVARQLEGAFALMAKEPALRLAYCVQATETKVALLTARHTLRALDEAEDTYSACIDVLERFHSLRTVEVRQKLRAYTSRKAERSRLIGTVRIQAWARGWLVRRRTRALRGCWAAVSGSSSTRGGSGAAAASGSSAVSSSSSSSSVAAAAASPGDQKKAVHFRALGQEQTSRFKAVSPGVSPVGSAARAVKSKRANVAAAGLH